MKDNFKNKKILITGVNGFVGSALEKRLSSLGSEVFGISKSGSSNKRILNADILDYPTIDNFVKANGIKICFHLASKALVEEGQQDPYETFKVNVDGTLNILQIAHINKLEKIIIASTSHVYGDNKEPYVEEYTPKPSRPYETSKTCADLIAQSYAQSFNLPVLIPRFVNIYGPGDLNFQRLIPKTIKSIFEGSSPQMWGGTAIRDYLYIDDAIDAYLLLAKMEVKGNKENRVFNFGGNNIISVEDLIKKIISLSGKKFEIKKIRNEREDEIDSQYVSFDKATKLLGWKPKIGLDEGLIRTIDWYLKNSVQSVK